MEEAKILIIFFVVSVARRSQSKEMRIPEVFRAVQTDEVQVRRALRQM